MKILDAGSYLWEGGRRIRRDPLTNRFALTVPPSWQPEPNCKLVLWTGDGTDNRTFSIPVRGLEATVSGDEVWVVDGANISGYQWADCSPITSVPAPTGDPSPKILTLASGTVVCAAFSLQGDQWGLSFKVKPPGGNWSDAQPVTFAISDPSSAVQWDIAEGKDLTLTALFSIDARGYTPLMRFKVDGDRIVSLETILEYYLRPSTEFPRITLASNPTLAVYASHQLGPQEPFPPEYNPCASGWMHFNLANIDAAYSAVVTLPGLCNIVNPGCPIFPFADFIDSLEQRWLSKQETADRGAAYCDRVWTHRRFTLATSQLTEMGEVANFCAWHSGGLIVVGRDDGYHLENLVTVPPPTDLTLTVSTDKKVYTKGQSVVIACACNQPDVDLAITVKWKNTETKLASKTGQDGIGYASIAVRPNWKNNVIVGATATKAGFESAFATTTFRVT